MNLSFDDAMFYKVLLQSGFKEDVDKWIDEFINNTELLEGIYLDLACCYSNLNETISCLHNYIGENPINDKEVCTRLRVFIKNKLENNEISIERATDALISFASDRWQEKYWSDFYMISIYDEYLNVGFSEQVETFAMVREFINTGKRLDANKFWLDRKKKNKIVRKKENKYKILSAVVLFLYSILIMVLSSLLMLLEKHFTGTVSDKSLGIYIVIVCLLIVPPVVICVVGWDMVYDRLSMKKNKREKIKEERKLIEEQRKVESDAIREKFNLESDILTSYEYNTISMNKFSSKGKWILLTIFEILCLSMTVGSVFYFDLVTPELGIAIMMLGISFGIYGFCILCDAPIKGIVYSLLPVLCYALPLVIVYYIINVDTEWIIGLSTIIFGSILFVLFMVIAVVKPMKKKNAASIKYWNLLEEKYPKMQHYSDYYHLHSGIAFWKKDGTHVSIFEYKKGYYSIILTGSILFEGVKLDNEILIYIESKNTFDNCVKMGLELLEKNNM